MEYLVGITLDLRARRWLAGRWTNQSSVIDMEVGLCGDQIDCADFHASVWLGP